MSFEGQVRFFDQHDRTRGPPPNQNQRGGGHYIAPSRGGQYNQGGFRAGRNRGSRGGSRGGRGRGSRGGSPRGYRQDAQSAIVSKFRGRGDWRSRQHSSGGIRQKSSLADDEDDVSMSEGGENSKNMKGHAFSKARGGYRGRNNFNGTRDSWFRVNVPYGRNTDRKYLVEKLNELLDIPINPTNYHIAGDNAVFFIKDGRVAEAIRSCSRRITNSEGFKMSFYLTPCNPPIIKLDEAAIEKIKVAMSNRYTPSVKSLDLSDFHNDELLNKEGVYPVMSRQSTMELVAKIIGEHIPEVECLLLSCNRLDNLDVMVDIVTKAPNINKMDLSQNNIHSEFELDKIKDMKLIDMKLEKNPLTRKYKEESLYVTAVRKRFPKLLKLDGNDLPAPISFALEAETELPLSKGSFFLSDTAKDVVLAFLEEYFRIYDSTDRQKLMDAYHVNAYFSMSVFVNKSFGGRQPQLGEYSRESRNLKVIKDVSRQQKALMNGRLQIVAMLNQLPRSQHDASTINVDITLATPSMMSFTVTGVFKETSGKNMDIRSFSRVFITVPQGTGIVILNEQLAITNPSPDMIAKSFKDPAPTPAPSPVLPTSSAATQSAADIQQEMIRQFSLKSGMNADWSAKCLAHNQWDYERSAKVFTEMMAKGQIPPEAFVNISLPS